MIEPGDRMVVDEARGRMRAADADRERVAEHLRRGHAEGRLDLVEYDERVQAAWAALTYGELAAITADLPEVLPAPAEIRPEPGPGTAQQVSDQRGAVGFWAFVSMLNLSIWAIICLATTSWVYPWWIWVAGPWGAVLLAHRVAEGRRAGGRGAGDGPGRFGRRSGTTYNR